MPDPNLKQSLREAFAAVAEDAIVLHTIELHHPVFNAPVRVVRNHSDTDSWLAVAKDPADIRRVLNALDAKTRKMTGLIARLEDSAPVDGGRMVPFVALAFEFDLPPVESVPQPEMQIVIDNVGHEIAEALDRAATSAQKITVIYRPYRADDIEGPGMDPPMRLTLFDARATALQVTARARLFDVGRRRFPWRRYDLDAFPMLAQ